MAKYSHPEVLVETDWVKANLGRPHVKLVEIDVDTKAYETGHIPGAIAFNWQTQLQDPIRRDILSKEGFEKLAGGAGISPGDTVVLYGDNHNWFAAYGFWLFKICGHKEVCLMNGGRGKWLEEPDKPRTTKVPRVASVPYEVREIHLNLRAVLGQVLDAQKGSWNLVDVRSLDEFSGKIIAPAGMTETAQRGGHIPRAKSIPWDSAVNWDGTFKSADKLSEIYLNEGGIDPKKHTIAYCRIGERSSHTWFALKYLLGLKNVKNYDGGWTEYGSLVGAPIEKG